MLLLCLGRRHQSNQSRPGLNARETAGGEEKHGAGGVARMDACGGQQGRQAGTSSCNEGRQAGMSCAHGTSDGVFLENRSLAGSPAAEPPMGDSAQASGRKKKNDLGCGGLGLRCDGNPIQPGRNGPTQGSVSFGPNIGAAATRAGPMMNRHAV